MATYPCSDDPSEIIEAVVGAGENAEKFDKFVNGGVTEEVQLGTGQPTPTLRNTVHLVKTAAATLDGADVSGKSSDAANGGTELRTLSERFGDLVNIKDFGAAGDGVANDTAAWTAWQTALSSGGIGYIPAGDYLVNGSVKHFSHGCLGNGSMLTWDSYMNTEPYPEANFPRQGTNEAIIKDYRYYDGPTSWSPQLELSFDSVCDSTPAFSTHGPGPIGLEVRGSSKGSSDDTMPIGIRSVIENCLNGDGDAVAVWGRTKKTDPDGGVNNSDSCAGHFSTVCSSVGTGISMATEHWAVCDKAQGEQGTAAANFFMPGGIVAQHVILNGRQGMVQTGILFNGSGSSDYGAWSAITINNNLFKFNGETAYPERTAAIKAATLNMDACPEAFLHLGWCPKHVRMVGAYEFNVSANSVRTFSNTTDDNVAVCVVDQRKSDSSEEETPTIGFVLLEKDFSGIEQAPNVTVYDNSDNPRNPNVHLFDLYHQRGNHNIFYRAMNQSLTHHAFYATDSNGVLGEVLNVWHTTVRPGRDNEQHLGDAEKRWSTVFAGTGTINTSDERVKDNINAPSEALMRAWGKVNFKVFQMKDAIASKGVEAARLHVGVIAQQVIAAFAEEGLDATRYGLLCHDSWDAEEPKIQRHWIEDEMERRDDDGNLIAEARGHYEEFVEDPGREAGDLYSIRYDEALALECAYQRWRLEQIEARLAAVEAE